MCMYVHVHNYVCMCAYVCVCVRASSLMMGSASVSNDSRPRVLPSSYFHFLCGSYSSAPPPLPVPTTVGPPVLPPPLPLPPVHPLLGRETSRDADNSLSSSGSEDNESTYEVKSVRTSSGAFEGSRGQIRLDTMMEWMLD